MRKLTGGERPGHYTDRKFGRQWKVGQEQAKKDYLFTQGLPVHAVTHQVRKPPGTSRVQGPGPSRTASNTSSNRGSNDHRHGEET